MVIGHWVVVMGHRLVGGNDFVIDLGRMLNTYIKSIGTVSEPNEDYNIADDDDRSTNDR